MGGSVSATKHVRLRHAERQAKARARALKCSKDLRQNRGKDAIAERRGAMHVRGPEWTYSGSG